MARTIDERIVQMTFNNEEFERRASTTISTLERLKGSLDFSKMSTSFTGLQKSVDNVDFSGFTSGLIAINNGFSVMEQIATGALRRIGDTITGHVLSAINNVKNAITSLTTQQINVGYNKYNDLTSSVQTLVNSTGKSVDEIDKYLKRLMWYSDETSFGFTDMTKALGTMVASGGEIDKLIPLLMGVGNATAYAGKGAAEFSRVIYNLNQSYSMGYLNTLDWKSISMASVDSKELKNQLIGAALALKKIKAEDAKLENFSKLLSDQVFDREVMEQAFGNFAKFTLEVEEAVNSGLYETASEAMEALSGSVEKYAEDAMVAAQSAKSFREVIEATQDAVSSGWMTTFQLIFGDYNESKALWTDVVDTFWDLFASGAKRRNAILETWKDIWDNMIKNPDEAGIDYSQWKEMTPWLTQTQALVASISDVIIQIRDDVSSVWRSVFPIHTMLDEHGKVVEDYSKTAKVIFNTVESIRKVFIDIRDNGLNGDIAVALRSSFRALLEVINTLTAYVKVFNDSFVRPLSEKLKPLITEIAGIIKNIADAINRTARNARSDMTPFEKFLTNILNILDPIIDAIQKVLHWINELVGGVKQIDVFDGIFKTIGNVVEFISNAVSGSIPVLQTLGDLLGTVFEKIKTGVQEFLQQSGTDVSKIAEGGFLGYLTYGLVVVIKKFKEFIDTFKISNVSKGLMDGFAQGIKDTFGALKEGIDSLLGRGGGGAGYSGLKQIADAIMELAAALFVLSLIDSDKIVGSLAGIAVVLAEVMGAIAILNGMSFGKKFTGEGKGIQKFFSSISAGIKNLTGQGNNDFKTAIKAVKDLAFVILELSVALKIMSTIDPLGMTTALVGLGVALGELAVFMVILSGVSKDLQAGDTKALAKMLSKLGFAMIEISAAMKIMSTLDGNGLSTALIGMGAALAEIGAFVIAVSKWTGEGAAAKIAMLGPAMIGIGLALIEVAAAMRILSKIDATGVDTALVALFGALGSIALFTVAISRFTKGGAVSFVAISAGLLVMAAAIGGFTVALTALAALGIEKVIEGLKGFILMAGALGIASIVLGTLSPLLLAASIALAAFAGSLYVISTAMIKAAEAFTLFKVIGSDFALTIVSMLTDAFTALIAVVPAALIALVEAIMGVAVELVKLVATLITMVLDALTEQLPSVIESVVNFIAEVLKGLINAVETLGPLLFDFVFGILDVFITKLREHLPNLVENLLGLFGDLINSLADGIRNNGQDIGTALGNLATAIIEGLISAIGGVIGGLGKGVLSIGSSLFSGISGLWKTLFGGKDQEKDQKDSGVKIVDNVVTGMDSNKQTIYDKGNEIGNQTAKELEDADEAEKSGKYTLDGLLSGLEDSGLLNSIYNAGKEAGRMFMRGYNEEMAIASPSKVMEKEAEYTIAGLLRGFKDLREVSEAGSKLGNTVYDSVCSALALASEIMDDELNPVITPVLDLSDIMANKDAVQDLLGSDLAYDGALSINRLQNGTLNQNGLNPNPINVNIDFTVNNAGKDLTDEDVMKFSRQITNEVNLRLGRLLSI